MFMNTILKQTSISISIALLFVVWYDFLVLNEYHIESSAMIGICTVLLFNIARHFSKKINSTSWLHIIICITILGVTIAAFFFLLLMSFGIGYTGRKVPLHHIFGVFLTISLLIVTVLEFHRVLNKK